MIRSYRRSSTFLRRARVWILLITDDIKELVNKIMGLQGIEWVVLRGHSGGNGCGEGLSWL